MLLAFLFSLSAFAVEPILVTAPREYPGLELPFFSTGVAGEEWDRRGGQVEESLVAVPGLNFSTGGGPGQVRGVFIRGARAEDTLVLIDGVPANDPFSTARGFDFSQIPGDVERIEILKGPQSVLYGSDAMGGVVQVYTNRNPKPRARLEGGSYGTIRGRASAHGFHAGYEQSEGFSAADARDGNSEKDGHRAWQMGGARTVSLSDSATLRLQGLFRESRTDSDKGGGAGGDSMGTRAENSQLLLRAESVKLFDNGAEWAFAGTHYSYNRDDNTIGPTEYRGNLWKLESNVKRTFGSHTLLAGADYKQEAGRSTDVPNRQRFRGGALLAQDLFSRGRWQVAGGARMDFHSEHSRATTFRVGAGYWLVADRLLARLSAGSGFKAPSLYQTYSIYGSRNLRPSRIYSGDLGLEYSGEKWGAELVYYRNYFRELIDYDIARNVYFNVGRARSSGVELALKKSLGLFELRGALASLRAYDQTNGKKLYRRPSFSGSAEIAYAAGLNGASIRARYVGKREDVHPTLFTRQPMPAFVVFSADAFRNISPGWKIFARGENLLNRRYQETSGFGTAGLSGYLGLEADL